MKSFIILNHKEQESPELDLEVKSSRLHEIILYNDDVNTFDHVIRTLIEVCEHTPEQAEQCSLIVHYKGKCSVKSGTYDELEPKCIRLHAAGLSAEIV
ncbi:MAG: ATP-dependent Clp protease adaptor ClpS [Bacteroidota bacterium]|nr:ATP-dependent Clp protease adaptor ClpS [Bacteroidota bacterium]MEC8097659.1 ATP-dependent Clp protease adaptor ClpS [Bacteroidota bacterium]